MIPFQNTVQPPVILVSGSSLFSCTSGWQPILANEEAVKEHEMGQFCKNRSAAHRDWCAYRLHHLSQYKHSKLFLEAVGQMLGIFDVPIHWLPPCISWEVICLILEINAEQRGLSFQCSISSTLGREARKKQKIYGWLCPEGEVFGLPIHAVNFLLLISINFFTTLKNCVCACNGRGGWREEGKGVIVHLNS